MFLLFGAFGSSALAADRNHTVSKGESIWNISEALLGNASIEEIDSLKDKIIILNGMDPDLDDGIPTTKPGDPDYIVPEQMIIISASIDENVVPGSIPEVPVVPTPVNTNEFSDYDEDDEVSTDYSRINNTQEEVKALFSKVEGFDTGIVCLRASSHTLILVSAIVLAWITILFLFIKYNHIIFKRS